MSVAGLDEASRALLLGSDLDLGTVLAEPTGDVAQALRDARMPPTTANAKSGNGPSSFRRAVVRFEHPTPSETHNSQQTARRQPVRSVVRRPKVSTAGDGGQPRCMEPDSPARRGSENPVLVETAGISVAEFAGLSTGDAGVLEGSDISTGPLLAVSPHIDRVRPIRGGDRPAVSLDWRDTSLDTLVSDLKLSAGPSHEGKAAGLRAAQIALRLQNMPHQVPPELPQSSKLASRPTAVRRAVKPAHEMPMTRPRLVVTRSKRLASHSQALKPPADAKSIRSQPASSHGQALKPPADAKSIRSQPASSHGQALKPPADAKSIRSQPEVTPGRKALRRAGVANHQPANEATSVSLKRDVVVKGGFLDRREVLVERVLQASETPDLHVPEPDSNEAVNRAPARRYTRIVAASSSDSDSDESPRVQAATGKKLVSQAQLRWPAESGRAVRLPRFDHPAAPEEVKPATRPEVKPATRPEVKPATRPEVKPATRPEVKPATRPEVKPATPIPAPDTRADVDYDVGSSLESTGYARAFRRQQRHKQKHPESNKAEEIASMSAHVQWGFPLAETLRSQHGAESPVVPPPAAAAVPVSAAPTDIAAVPGSELRVRRGLAEVLAATRDMVSRVRASAQALRLEEDDELEWSLGSTDAHLKRGKPSIGSTRRRKAQAPASVVSSSRSVISEQPVHLGMGRLASARGQQARAGPRGRYPRQRPPLAATRRATSAARGGAGHARQQQPDRWVDGSLGQTRRMPHGADTAWEAQGGAGSGQNSARSVAVRSEPGRQATRAAGRSRSAARRYRDVVAPATTRTRRSAATRSARDRV